MSCKGKVYLFERYMKPPKVYDKINKLCEEEGIVYGTLQKQMSQGIEIDGVTYYCHKDYRVWRTDLIK